jgi:hypothetical protein
MRNRIRPAAVSGRHRRGGGRNRLSLPEPGRSRAVTSVRVTSGRTSPTPANACSSLLTTSPVEGAVDNELYGRAIFSLVNLILDDRRMLAQDGSEHVRMDAQTVRVDGHIIQSALRVGDALEDRSARSSPDKDGHLVGHLVADQRLEPVVEVVTHALSERTPGGTGVPAASTGSKMHRSSGSWVAWPQSRAQVASDRA